MKRFAYKVLLETLKFLVLGKRFLVRSGRKFGIYLEKTFKWTVRHVLLGGYKQYVSIRRKIERRIGSTEEQIYTVSAKNWIVSSVAIILVISLVMPHSRFFTPSVYGAGSNSILLQVVGPGEEEMFYGDEIIIETAEQIEHNATSTAQSSDDPFSYGVRALAEPSGTDHDFGIEELAGIGYGGGGLSAPMIMPGAEVTPSRREVTTYVVQQGDVISTVAEKFGVSTLSILWENNLSSRSYIRPGDVLKILPVTGISHVVKRGDTLIKLAKKYDVDSVNEIVQFNRLADASDIVIGEKIIVPGGTKKYVAPVVTSRVYAPNSYSNVAPPPPSRYSAGSAMVWPTSGHVITQYYHARHHGIDVDGHYDSPLYASDSGVVKLAGWRGGYGLAIDIDHQNGIVTRYGHASKLFVSVGDRVTKGQVIAMMGTTGYSTGTHLHFEVMVNGRKMNPFQYVR